jgi:hypothetical protein
MSRLRLQQTFLLKKLSMIEAIKKVPTDVSKSIKRISDVRNALAHSLFPQNRRRYMAEKKVTYQGVDLFSRAGPLKLHEDYDIVYKYFEKKGLWVASRHSRRPVKQTITECKRRRR